MARQVRMSIRPNRCFRCLENSLGVGALSTVCQMRRRIGGKRGIGSPQLPRGLIGPWGEVPAGRSGRCRQDGERWALAKQRMMSGGRAGSVIGCGTENATRMSQPCVRLDGGLRSSVPPAAILGQAPPIGQQERRTNIRNKVTPNSWGDSLGLGAGAHRQDWPLQSVGSHLRAMGHPGSAISQKKRTLSGGMAGFGQW